MGEVADSILDGDFCQECGEYMGEGDGYPRSCPACQRGNREQRAQRAALAAPKVACDICGKKVKAAGLQDHQRDSHGKQFMSAPPSA